MKTTRRQFLAAGTGVLAGASLLHAGEEDAHGWIDAHVHVWTPDTTQYPNAKGWSRKGLRASFTPEELFAECRPQGVSRIVLIQMSFYKFDNSYMLDMMRKHKGVFGGVAIVDETATGLAKRMRELKRQGVHGFRVYANARNAANWVKSSSKMHDMWREAARTRQSICCLADPDALPSIRRLCKLYPETPVVIDHFARIGIRKIDEKQLDQLLKLSDFKHTAVKTSAFYALGQKAPPYDDLGPMIRKLRDAYGADRLMWASDCPFQTEGKHSYKASLALIRDRLDFLSEAEKTAMLRGTAERLFF